MIFHYKLTLDTNAQFAIFTSRVTHKINERNTVTSHKDNDHYFYLTFCISGRSLVDFIILAFMNIFEVHPAHLFTIK